MTPTDKQIDEYREYCFKKRLLEVKPERFYEFLTEWYHNEPSMLACLQAIKEKDIHFAGELLNAWFMKELNYYVEQDVQNYINDFADSEVAARSDELYDRRKDAA
jgi:hypothetical protein